MAAHYSPSRALLNLVRSFRRLDTTDPLTRCLAPRISRSFASQTDLPVTDLAKEIEADLSVESGPPSDLSIDWDSAAWDDPSQILTTSYSWPHLEPRGYAVYNPQLLGLPLRRDLLHRAVIYEADNSRQGTASTKWRGQVHGSNRKIQQQKGTGRARVGDKKSPIRRGGGVAFGPHPHPIPGMKRFSSELPRKVYDIAIRTALSYRYQKGELVIIEGDMKIPPQAGGRLLSNIFEGNNWGKGNGRSLLVTEVIRERLFDRMQGVGEHGLIKDYADVDVKDLLEMGRIVIEKGALDSILVSHMSDLGLNVAQHFVPKMAKPYIVSLPGRLSFERLRASEIPVETPQGLTVEQLVSASTK